MSYAYQEEYKTQEEWLSEGMVVKEGERYEIRDAWGTPLYNEDQVDDEE